jgi:ER-bound oxygenase mpaB/B'/Rubber oxygenase, catalytic domain
VVQDSPMTAHASVLLQDPPQRHGADLTTTRRIASRLRLMIRGNPEPTSDEWAKLGAALWRGDPLADDVAHWLAQVGMGVGRPMLERAIEHGLDAVPNAPEALCRFIQAAQQTPDWVDAAQLARGARFIQSTGQHGMLVLRDAGLMAGYQASAINKTLVMTGSLQSGAQRRLAQTSSWWMDCTADGGLDRHSAGFKTTLRVRAMHALVRQNLLSRPDWDSAAHGLPINQVDMQATYLGFSAVHLIALRITGVVVSRADGAAMMHLWRYIGWLMGVEEGLLSETEMQGRISLYQNVISQAPPDDSSAALGRALMDEPLNRHYPWGGALRGRFNRARHLSMLRLFVGLEGMRHLGLPPALPWHPVLTTLPRLLWTGLHRLLPGGQARLVREGRARQLRYMPIVFGKHPPVVAQHVAP